MTAATTATTTNVTIDADGRLVLPAEALRALRPEGELLTLLDVEIDAENGRLLLRRSTIAEEDWWAYTPEMRARIERASRRPVEQDRRLSEKDLEALAPVDPE
jgi:hypothetical protein